ncbi:hypothetical protein P9112_014018 [Eukaryota sp. TZLM1-RC]
MILFLAFVLLSSARASILSSSTLESCTNSDEFGRICDTKAVVLLNMEGSQSSTIETHLSSLGDKSLDTAANISCTRSTPKVVYGLHYQESLPYAYREHVEGFSVLRGCHAPTRPDGRTPSCSFMLDSEGKPIDHSSGFCCTCDLGSTILNRNSLACQLTGNSFRSVHCLRPTNAGSIRSLNIGRGNVDFDIECTLSTRDFTTSIHLTPNTRRALSEKDLLLGSIEGTLDGFNNHFPPIRSELFFNVSANESLILSSDRAHSLNSYNVHRSFASTPSTACFEAANPGAINSIENLVKEDRKRVGDNRMPRYLASRFGNWRVSNSFLEFDLDSYFGVMLRLEFVADSLLVSHQAVDIVIKSIAVRSEETSGGRLPIKIDGTLENQSKYRGSVVPTLKCVDYQHGFQQTIETPPPTVTVDAESVFDLELEVVVALSFVDEHYVCEFTILESFSGKVLDYREFDVVEGAHSEVSDWTKVSGSDVVNQNLQDSQSCPCVSLTEVLCLVFNPSCFRFLGEFFSLGDYIVGVVAIMMLSKLGVFKLFFWMMKTSFKVIFFFLKCLLPFKQRKRKRKSKKQKKRNKKSKAKSSKSSKNSKNSFSNDEVELKSLKSSIDDSISQFESLLPSFLGSISQTRSINYRFLNLNNVNAKRSIIKNPPSNGRISLAGFISFSNNRVRFRLLPSRRYQLLGFKGNEQFKLKKQVTLDTDLFNFSFKKSRLDEPQFAKLISESPKFIVIN